MKFSIFQDSRIGRRHSNQDRAAWRHTDRALLMVVADGMGGHLHGEVAAQTAVQVLVDAFTRLATPRLAAPSSFLGETLREAHAAINVEAWRRGLPTASAPRTTVVACVVQDGTAWWAHAGDSRLYAIRHGRLLTRTRDHSHVQSLVDRGLISEAEASRHPERNLVASCLGGPAPPAIELSAPQPLAHGDTLVLCTDGAWGPLGDALVLALAGSDLRQRIPRLLDRAELLAGDTADNLTLVAMTWLAVPADTPPLGATTAAEDIDTLPLAELAAATPLSDADIAREVADIRRRIHTQTSRTEPKP